MRPELNLESNFVFVNLNKPSSLLHLIVLVMMMRMTIDDEGEDEDGDNGEGLRTLPSLKLHLYYYTS